MKRITRRQARAWLLPMRKCLRQIRATGEADSIRGYAVTRLHAIAKVWPLMGYALQESLRTANI